MAALKINHARNRAMDFPANFNPEDSSILSSSSYLRAPETKFFFQNEYVFFESDKSYV